MAEKIRTFVLVYENKIISPPLVTIREYANWMEKYFDEYTCHLTLYINANKGGGTAAEWHPGTRIGQFFDHNRFSSSELCSWFIPNNMKAMEQLEQHNFAVKRDGKMLRLYTIKQVELYLKNTVDDTFTFGNNIVPPKQIVLSKEDYSSLIQPKQQVRKRLF